MAVACSAEYIEAGPIFRGVNLNIICNTLPGNFSKALTMPNRIPTNILIPLLGTTEIE